jgi:hypothetical protein
MTCKVRELSGFLHLAFPGGKHVSAYEFVQVDPLSVAHARPDARPAMPAAPARRFALVVLPAIFVLLGACDSGSGGRPTVSPAVFDAGDTWTYDVLFTQRPVETSEVDTVRTATVRVRVASTDVALGPRSGLVEVASFEAGSPEVVSRTWYQQSPDSLVAVAYNTTILGLTYDGPSAAPDAALSRSVTGLPLLVRRRLDGPPASKQAVPDTVLRPEPRVVLRSPLTPGTAWTSFEQPFLSTRSVEQYATVETPAGRFESVEIATRLPQSFPSLRWSDYYTPDGLVRRVVTDTLAGRAPEGGQTQAYVVREQYDLVDFQP